MEHAITGALGRQGGIQAVNRSSTTLQVYFSRTEHVQRRGSAPMALLGGSSASSVTSASCRRATCLEAQRHEGGNGRSTPSRQPGRRQGTCSRNFRSLVSGASQRRPEISARLLPAVVWRTAERLRIHLQQRCNIELRQATGPPSESSEADTRSRRRQRRLAALGMLNILAILNGTSTAATKFVDDDGQSASASLTTLIRSASAAAVFAPAMGQISPKSDKKLLRAGVELGLWSFIGNFSFATGLQGGPEDNALLLFAFTIFFVPIMELGAGRAVSQSTWRATLAAMTGMGLLEEEQQDWHGLPVPHLSSLGSLVGPVLSAAHIFRSEALGSKFDPLRLTAVQLATQAVLGLAWECACLASSPSATEVLPQQLQSVPWLPLLYSGLACSGACTWLELQGLRHIHASTATMVYTTIPIWGAVFSYFVTGETPGAAALLGGALILLTSLSAQATIMEEDLTVSRNQRKERAEIRRAGQQSPGADKQGQEQQGEVAQAPDGEASDEPQVVDQGVPRATATHLPAALLTSQLKAPFYAVQAKRVMGELKLKLSAVKALLLAATQIQLPTSSSSVANVSAVSTSLSQAPDSTTGHLVTQAASVSSVLDATASHAIPDILSQMEAATAATLQSTLQSAEAGALTLGAGVLSTATSLETALDTTTAVTESLAQSAGQAIGDKIGAAAGGVEDTLWALNETLHCEERAESVARSVSAALQTAASDVTDVAHKAGEAAGQFLHNVADQPWPHLGSIQGACSGAACTALAATGNHIQL